MPNWCYNNISIVTESPSVLQKFIRDKSIFDDDRIINSIQYHIHDDGKSAWSEAFESAWTPPIQSLLLASHRYPELTFSITYEEVSNDFQGEALISDGVIMKDMQWAMSEARVQEESKLISEIVYSLVRYTLGKYDYEHIQETFTDFIERSDLYDRDILNRLTKDHIKDMLDIIKEKCKSESIIDEYPETFLTQILVDYQDRMNMYCHKNTIHMIKNCFRKLVIKKKLFDELTEFSLSPPINDYPLLSKGGSIYRECLVDWTQKCQ